MKPSPNADCPVTCLELEPKRVKETSGVRYKYEQERRISLVRGVNAMLASSNIAVSCPKTLELKVRIFFDKGTKVSSIFPSVCL